MSILYDDNTRSKYNSENDKEFNDWLLHKIVDAAWKKAKHFLNI